MFSRFALWLGFVMALSGLAIVNRGGPGPASPVEGAEPSSDTPAEDASYERGGTAYYQLCHVCHGEDGTGAPIIDDPDNRKMAPPLSRSRRVLGRPEYVITALLTGVTGPIDEENYQSLMVSMASYNDEWIADVASYIRNSFENEASMITSNQVARIRKRLVGRTDPLTVEEIISTMPVPLTNQASWKVTASLNSTAAINAIRRWSTNAWTSGSPKPLECGFKSNCPNPFRSGISISPPRLGPAWPPPAFRAGTKSRYPWMGANGVTLSRQVKAEDFTLSSLSARFTPE
jgi:mono/diheme cytochrome c family protein